MTGREQLRILLVDDNDVILERAAETLSPTFTIIGAVKDGFSALEAVSTLDPDVIVLDISMPGMTGLEVAGRLRRMGVAVPIVFLTIHDDPGLIRAAMAAGGIGYVEKTFLASDLTIAVNQAYAGRQYVSQMR